jgi:hypothetical protein
VLLHFIEQLFACKYVSVLPKLTRGVAVGTGSEPLPKIELALYLAEADATSERLS